MFIMKFFSGMLASNLIIAATVYSLSGISLRKLNRSDETFIQNSIKNQLSMLSKCWFSLFSILVVILFMLLGDYEIFKKAIIPAQILYFWYILLRVEPSAHHDLPNISGECGLKNTQYSRMKDRQKENIFLVVGTLIIGISLLIDGFKPLIEGNLEERVYISMICKLGIERANEIEPKLVTKFLSAMACTNSSVVNVFSYAGIIGCFVNIVLGLKKGLVFIYENSGKRGAINKIIGTIIGSSLLNIFLLIGFTFIALYQNGIFESTKLLIADDMRALDLFNNQHLMMEFTEASVQRYWLKFNDDILVKSINQFMAVGAIMFGFITLHTCCKLLVLYRYSYIVNNLKGKAREDLSEFHTYLLRIVFNPKGLKDKQETKAFIVSYIERLKSLKQSERNTILFGSPLAITSSWLVALSCYIEMLKLEKN